MSERSEIDARLQSLYAARVRGDLADVCACFTPDAHLRFAGSSGTHPIAISAAGQAELRHLLAIMVKSFKLAEFETLATLVDGARAAVHWRARIHSRITGTAVLTDFLDLFELRGGLIVNYQEFFAPR